MKRVLSKYVFLSVIAWFALGAGHLKAQDDLQIVQVSGIVMNQDNTSTIFGVNIYNARTGRGTNSNYQGWFSKAFIGGDTLTFSAIGYKTQKIPIPTDQGDRFSLVVEMEEDVTQLGSVEINPFPTEELFKEAILAMNLSETQEDVLRNYSPEVLNQMVRTMPIEGSPDQNYRFMMNQQYYNLQNAAGPRANPLLNPFAWGQFINSLKKKKKK